MEIGKVFFTDHGTFHMAITLNKPFLYLPNNNLAILSFLGRHF